MRRAAERYKTSLQETAQGGQQAEDDRGQALADSVLSAPGAAVHGAVQVGRQMLAHAEDRQEAFYGEGPFDTAHDSSYQSTGAEPVPSPPESSHGSPSKPVLRIKEKDAYIQSQPGQGEQYPSEETIHRHAAEQGRQLAIQQSNERRAIDREVRTASGVKETVSGERSPDIREQYAIRNKRTGKRNSFNPTVPANANTLSDPRPKTIPEGQALRLGTAKAPLQTTSAGKEFGSSMTGISEKAQGIRVKEDALPVPEKSRRKRKSKSAGRPLRPTGGLRHRNNSLPTPAHPTPSASSMRQRMQSTLVRQGETVRSVGNTVRSIRRSVEAGSHAVRSLIAAIAAGGAGVAVVVVLIVVLFGAMLSLTGGDNAEALLPVSDEVRAYEPTIRLYAAQYGIPEYVDLIMAVMMQESGGRGLDPMQAAEGSYNTRYPHVPNGITDPDYSIQCGIQELRDSLNRAGVQSPVDMDHIRLALQGYNFGPGYVSWAVSHYGGYSLANAAEYSDMQAARLGWARYGDKEYVPHVLRYYPFGRVPTGFGNGAIVEIALSQEGNDGIIYWSWFEHTSRVAWCSEFASWCASQAGLVDAGLAPCVSVCTDGVAWFQERGRFVDASFVPSSGYFIYFDWNGDRRADHVGIVESVSGGRVYTVEGNSGDRVRRNSYSLTSSSILGYGIVG